MSRTPLRILGLTEQHITHQGDRFVGKDAGLYNALQKRYEVIGAVCAELPQHEYYLRRLSTFHPNRTRWIMRTIMSPHVFRRRSAIAEAQLPRWRGAYDLIMQLHTLTAPGLRRPERPYVLTTDNTYLLSDRFYAKWSPLTRRERDDWVRLERATYANAAFLFPWSEFVRRSMIEDYGIAPERVVATGAGLNLEPGAMEGKRYDTATAIFVGGDFERKGGFALLRAWDLVRRKMPEAQLQIIGTRKQYAPDQPGVTWVGRVNDRAVLAEYYSRATLFVMPSIFEPWGHVFLEAAARGLPCIGANRCAMPEIITEGVTGLLVPPEEPEPLAEAIVRVLSDPALAERMGRAGYDDVLRNRTWDRVIDRMAPYLEQAVEESSAAGRRLVAV